LPNLNQIFPAFAKEAGIVSSATSGVKSISKSIAKGILPVDKSAPIGEKIVGLGVKGLAGYGAYSLVRKAVTREPTPYDYTFMQRNRLLAGEIKPEEMSSDELNRVKRLGMKYD
jgi:hypothetical protein